MLEIRIHGRGGQGNVVAAYLLAIAAFEEGLYGQAFPSFGAERRGAPVTAFVRISRDPIRRRNQVLEPAFLIVQDHHLLHTPGVLDGLPENGGILVNSTFDSAQLSAEMGREVIAIPAAALAREILGRPVPNTALLAAFLSLTGLLPIDALARALGKRFKGALLEKNLELVRKAAELVPAGRWRMAGGTEHGRHDLSGLQALEGSQALAQAVALCRPGVVAAYPITPQTHIVENISKLVADGRFKTEFVSVESEFSAASVVLGAAMAGSRTYTASSAQGILLMAEVLFNIAGLRVPMVMTCANRAVSAPLSIWNDQQDSLSVRDAGWIQLYCEDNQEAIDTTIQAYRISERTELPVMVCVDGFTLTHTLEGVTLPDQQAVDDFLPPYRFSRTLDPRQPISVGTLMPPDYYTEVRHAHHEALNKAQTEIVAADREWGEVCGRNHGGLVHAQGPDEASLGILAMGSVLGTLRETMREMPPPEPVKLIKLRCFRPFPTEAVRAACCGLTDLVVLERALSPGGAGGIVGLEVSAALNGLDRPPRVHSLVVGLGGRDIPLDILARILQAVRQPGEGGFRILDLNLDKLPVEDR
jgi:pyruvate ferredoxin oxidoreductase alpha subunit